MNFQKIFKYGSPGYLVENGDITQQLVGYTSGAAYMGSIITGALTVWEAARSEPEKALIFGMCTVLLDMTSYAMIASTRYHMERRNRRH